MLKELLISAAIIAGFVSTASAQTCATPPSCASLGYSETAIKHNGWQCFACPFDPTKFSCTAKPCPKGSSTSQEKITTEEKYHVSQSNLYRFSLHCSSGFSGDKICREEKATYLDHKDPYFDSHVSSSSTSYKDLLPLAQQTCNGNFDL